MLSRNPSLSLDQLYLPLYMLQCIRLRAFQAEPEVLNRLGGGMKAKIPPALQPHELFGTLRIGALGDHSLWKGAAYLLTSINAKKSPEIVSCWNWCTGHPVILRKEGDDPGTHEWRSALESGIHSELWY